MRTWYIFFCCATLPTTFMISLLFLPSFFFFFFNDTATTEIYTLSLHDALPILLLALELGRQLDVPMPTTAVTNEFLTAARGMGLVEKDFAVVFDVLAQMSGVKARSEEHTSELQSHSDLVCRLLLEKKKKKDNWNSNYVFRLKRAHNGSSSHREIHLPIPGKKNDRLSAFEYVIACLVQDRK